MTQINNYSQNIPINNGYTQAVPQNQAATPQVNVTTPQGVTPVYQYPTTSVYSPNQKQAASGVNIYICNPSGVGNGCSCPYFPGQPLQTPMVMNPYAPSASATATAPLNGENEKFSSPIANTPIEEGAEKAKGKDKKQLVQITDELVHRIEDYLRNPDPDVRKMGIIELIRRFEEDESRYDHPALIALLNIALQDPVPRNTIMAMSPITTESAQGDSKTFDILQQLASKENKKMHGAEAKMAQEALLKLSHTKA